MLPPFSDRSSLKNAANIESIHNRLATCLELELRTTHGDCFLMLFQRLQLVIHSLQNLSAQHIAILRRFLETSPQFDLPPLYNEIFVTDN